MMHARSSSAQIRKTTLGALHALNHPLGVPRRLGVKGALPAPGHRIDDVQRMVAAAHHHVPAAVRHGRAAHQGAL